MINHSLRIFLFCLVLITSHSVLAQFKVNIYFQHPPSLSNSDSIYYDTAKKLVWNNFQGKPIETGNVGAITSSGFGYKASMRSVDGEANLTLNIYCSFLKSKSWVKHNKKTDYILNHEQHHFDITFIGTSLFVKKLREAKFTINNYSQLIKEIYSDTYAAMHQLQDQYDGETKNGQLEDKQKEWDKKIAVLIQDLNK